MVNQKQNLASYLALTGGVGGAKLAVGLYHLLNDKVSFAVNTGDDFELYGLHISPDIDTLMYTLADKCHAQQGWGRADETWSFMHSLQELGEQTWFQLGDKDLATHLLRTCNLKNGQTLSEVTAHLCTALGIQAPIYPMSDQSVRTQVQTPGGEWLDFQHYFVAEQCAPVVTGFRFIGADKATLSPGLYQSLQQQLAAIFICPSNPFVSVDPILSIGDMHARLKQQSAPVIAVTPIIGGQAIKGPTAKMMAELSMPTDAVTVARYYAECIDGFILDEQDEYLAPEIEALGIQVTCAQTIMQSFEDKVSLAQNCLNFADRLNQWKRSA